MTYIEVIEKQESENLHNTDLTKAYYAYHPSQPNMWFFTNELGNVSAHVTDDEMKIRRELNNVQLSSDSMYSVEWDLVIATLETNEEGQTVIKDYEYCD